MSENCKKVLAGDVGGTKSNLGLYLRKGKGCKGAETVELLAEARYENSEYTSFDEIVTEFLDQNLKGEGSGICCATFGIAATITDNRCIMTNLSWQIDASELSARFGFKKCSLINDLVATAWGLSGLTKDDLHILQPLPDGKVIQNGTSALIAAGTGLGEALIIGTSDDTAISAIATEGGHADFAPTDETQTELLNFLREKYGHVSYERVVSGSALKDIYDFFLLRRGGEVNAALAARFATEVPGAVITELGLLGDLGDKDCVDTLSLFVSAYGAEAGNLALKSLPRAGVYIGGGIAPKIVRAMESGFVDSFVAKGRFEEFMKTLPVYIILNEKTALLGAVIHASTGGGRST